ncbi:hypothetical protein V6N13_094292 [Hibiscus sabdariffa]
MVDGEGGWYWDKFHEFLPMDVLLRIVAVKGPLQGLQNALIFAADCPERFSVVEQSRWLRDWTVTTLATAGCPGSPQAIGLAGPVLWVVSEQGWVKVNVDGARRKGDGAIACGGVVRDDAGGWRGGFARFIGIGIVIEGDLFNTPPGEVVSILSETG